MSHHYTARFKTPGDWSSIELVKVRDGWIGKLRIWWNRITGKNVVLTGFELGEDVWSVEITGLLNRKTGVITIVSERRFK